MKFNVILFIKLVIFLLFLSLWHHLEAERIGFKRCWYGLTMALNKTKSEKFSWDFKANPIEWAYSVLRRAAFGTILPKL